MKVQSLLLLVLVGCSEDDAHHHHEESPIAVGCEHFAYGEDQPRTAALDTPGAEATLAAVHQRYVVTLPPTEGTEGAKLAFIANESGDFYFMLGEVVPFEVLQADAAGDLTMTPVEVVDPGETCTAAAQVHHYLLDAGTYTLVIGPTEATELTLVPHLDGQDHSH